MPKKVPDLTNPTIKRLKYEGKAGRPSMHPVGHVAGLCLQISAPTERIDSKGRTSKQSARSWIYRYTNPNTKRRREMGLGPYPTVVVEEAIRLAREARSALAEGRDPLEERNAQKREAARLEAERRALSVTFRQAAYSAWEKRRPTFRNDKHSKQWLSTIERYAFPVIGDVPVANVSRDQVRQVLEPIWLTKTDTAVRLRQRLEAVFDWSTASEIRKTVNPATWRGGLKELLPDPVKLKEARASNWPALQWQQAPTFFTHLKTRDGTAAQALLFAMLCANRSGEVRQARWDQIDLDERVWHIPKTVMKAKRDHLVPLSEGALEILKDNENDSELVFPAKRGGMLSDMALSQVMRRIHASEIAANRAGWVDAETGRPAVPHGLRSCFRDWAGEATEYPRELAELALAHKIGDATEQAYARGSLLERRRALMADWYEFLGQ